jgi:glycosyltransferase involved in cell wall biosynthesis
LSDWPDTRVGTRILHVSEALGGGIVTALAEYCQSTSDLEHILVAAERSKHDTGVRLDSLLDRRYGMTFTNPGKAMRQLRSVIRAEQPDVVHLHSSWAGFYGRLSALGLGIPVVYSPHCYFHERTDVPFLLRWLAGLVERLLSPLTTVVAALSPREVLLAERLQCAAMMVPNIVRIPEELSRQRSRTGTPRVIAVGRTLPQKDPLFFAEMSRETSRLGLKVEFMWVGGGGSPRLETALTAAGVKVTGWVPRAEVLDHLRRASVYAHTAAWEGSPMTILEAAAIGVPQIVRSIGATESLGLPNLVNTPQEAALRLSQIVNEAAKAGNGSEAVDPSLTKYLELHTPEVQRTALLDIYRFAAQG